MTPRQWLIDYARRKGNTPILLAIIRRLVRVMDADQIQDLFQKEMKKDGYFFDDISSEL